MNELEEKIKKASPLPANEIEKPMKVFNKKMEEAKREGKKRQKKGQVFDHNSF